MPRKLSISSVNQMSRDLYNLSTRMQFSCHLLLLHHINKIIVSVVASICAKNKKKINIINAGSQFCYITALATYVVNHENQSYVLLFTGSLGIKYTVSCCVNMTGKGHACLGEEFYFTPNTNPLISTRVSY